mgnify:CR=1 FL=1|jgi:hypothetical protein
MNIGEWVLYGGTRKKVFGIKDNGNIIIKMNRRLVQIQPWNCARLVQENLDTRKSVRIFTCSNGSSN